MSEKFDSCVLRIATRIAQSALWNGDTCTWSLQTANRFSWTSVELAGSNLYRGTPGIALFLAEVYRRHGDRDFGRVALGALRHALQEIPTNAEGPLCGFHSGLSGMAFALARTGQILRSEELEAAARRLVTQLPSLLRVDRYFDVIAGGAGAIPALLTLARDLDMPMLREFALVGGERLLERATRYPEGYSWGTKVGYVRGLTGFAHGASGIGLALAELYGLTGEERWRYGAEQAFAYERYHYLPQRGNWPDFRSPDILEAVTEGTVEELRARVKSGEPVFTTASSSMLAWCHGAPGIGLARLRAMAILNDESLEHEARLATNATLEAVNRRLPPNYSLCHGLSGNCETLWKAASVLNEPTLKNVVMDCMTEGIDRYEVSSMRWPSGLWEAGQDCSLLMGEAGIGYQLLRLMDETVPSVLMLEPDSEPAHGSDGKGIAEGAGAVSFLRDSDEHRWWGRTLSHITSLGYSTTRSPTADVGISKEGRALSPAIEFRDRWATIAGALEALVDPEVVADAAVVDVARMELMTQDFDLARDYLEALMREGTVFDEEWGGAWRLSGAVRVVKQKFDWAKLRASDSMPVRRPTARYLLIVRRGTSLEEVELTTLAGQVLELVGQSRSIESMMVEVSRGSGPTAFELRQKIVSQLRQAFQAGIVVRDWSVSTPAP